VGAPFLLLSTTASLDKKKKKKKKRSGDDKKQRGVAKGRGLGEGKITPEGQWGALSGDRSERHEGVHKYKRESVSDGWGVAEVASMGVGGGGGDVMLGKILWTSAGSRFVFTWPRGTRKSEKWKRGTRATLAGHGARKGKGVVMWRLGVGARTPERQEGGRCSGGVGGGVGGCLGREGADNTQEREHKKETRGTKKGRRRLLFLKFSTKKGLGIGRST